MLFYLRFGYQNSTRLLYFLNIRKYLVHLYYINFQILSYLNPINVKIPRDSVPFCFGRPFISRKQSKTFAFLFRVKLRNYLDKVISWSNIKIQDFVQINSILHIFSDCLLYLVIFQIAEKSTNQSIKANKSYNNFLAFEIPLVISNYNFIYSPVIYN